MQGRDKTEQRRTVRNRASVTVATTAGHHGRPRPPAWPGGVARDHTGEREHGLQGGLWELGYTRVATCTHDMHAGRGRAACPASPTHPP